MIKRFFILLLAIVASVGMMYAAAGISCTAEDRGKVVCTDGSIYATVSDATAASKTAVAMIAYIDTENNKGLALALVEESGNINWSNAIAKCAAKTPTVTGGTWKLASEDEWTKIVNAAGGRNALRDGFSAIGGTNLSSGGNDKYWSSTESSNTEKGRCISFNDTFGGWSDATKTATYPFYARACLAFDIVEPNPTGSCGENVTWEFDPSNGTLTISGTGAMEDYSYYTKTPWYNSRKSITSIIIQDGVTTVGNYSFMDLENLQSVVIGNDVVTIGSHAFEQCGTSFTSLTLGNSIVEIGEQAFINNSRITSINFPSTLQTIGEDAFYGCTRISSLTIPSSVTSIGDYAFGGCSLIAYIIAQPTTPPSTEENTFISIVTPSYIPLYVPNGSVAAYTAADRWNTFNIQGYDPSTGPTIEPVPATPDQLSGAFTINGDGDQINFSKGNLQYVGSWRFAENQWNIIGNDQADNNRDLFGWGTGDAPNKVSTTLADYAVYHEWGTNMGDGWYTLSRDEWTYLFQSRTNAANLYAPARVNGVSGFVILPDEFTLPSGLSFTAGVTNYGTNFYANAAWRAMENAGAVFLPVDGYRYDGNKIKWVGQDGFYWSSTVASEGASAWSWLISASNGARRDYYNLHYGMCVRLVKAVVLTPDDVMALINAIGTVEYTAESKKKIDAARKAYDGLSEADKALVTNYSTLQQAEAAYQAFIQAEADKVIAKIAALPNPVTAETAKLSVYNKVVDARTAYDALKAEEKALVTNLAILEAAEAFFDALPGGIPEGALKGAFTINAGGDRILFSKGNLQYVGSWQFAAHQWDIIGAGQADDNRDLFGWGTGDAPNKVSETSADYTTYTEWGTQMGAGWYTLDYDEWKYIFKTRANAANLYAPANVNGVNGIVLLPDEWKQPDGTTFTSGVKNFSTNVYADEAWTAMENAGAVFLPVAGYRYKGNINWVGESGFYWTSTVASAGSLSWSWLISASSVSRDYYNLYYGMSVRLVNAAGAGPIDAAQAAVALINAIPDPVTLDEACVKAIKDAREAVTALGEAVSLIDKADMDKLEQAEADYIALIKAEADKVIAKINAIPSPMTSENTKLSVYQKVQDARAAYDALTAEQKALVEAATLKRLTDAEAAFAAIGGGGAAAGALSGKFTINEDGDQISFAKGNLQATTTDLGEHWTWGFAANQWDLIGNAAANNAVNGNKTVSENGTVDLFGWSTPTTYYGISNSKNNDYYSSEFREWGENITGATWKTLNPSDWNYIIKNRADAADKHGQATVNGVNGYIFLPDEWELPTGLSFTAKPNNWTTNVYEGDDWTAMENAGALFLPMSPWRAGNTVTTLTAAYYWTSDYNSSYMAMAYSFQEDASVKFTGINRYAGIPVRLATAGGASPIAAAQAAVALINAIPDPVTLDEACVKAIKDAREAVTALGENANLIDAADMTKLTKAEAAYTALIQAGADAVKAKIAAIPQPVTLKLATRDSIESARAAYDALTADQKALVTNYAVLEAAEATWAGLVNVAPAGALSGKYTINAGGDVIYFAHGNLQYTRENLDADWSTGTFRLAENQYDMIEEKANPYCTDNYGDKTAVGLFGWGTWGEGKTPNLTSSNLADYTWSTDFVGTLEGTSTWRTLTKDEWVYLLTNHNMTYATVHGVNGLLIAPDGKDIDGKSMADWVVINDETWTTMQNDGYLFLPACGQRSQLSATANIITGGQGTEILYYSSTEYNTSKAYNIWYQIGSDPINDDYSSKRQAFGVRLVSAGVNPLDQVQVVKGLIDAIPAEITLDAACVNAIQAASDAYNALDNDAKAILDAADVKKLTDAVAALTALNQAEADKVVAKINNIPLPVELKLATRDSIQNARAAYDALNAAQQALVTNYQTLLDAEDALADLVPTPTPVPVTPTVRDMNELKVGDIIYEGDQLTIMSSPRYINNEVIRDNNCPYTLMKSAGETSYVLKDKDGSYLFTDGSLAITPTSVGLLVTNADHGDINVVVYSLANVLDSAQAVKDLIDAIPTPIEYPTSGPAIAAALVAYQQLSDAAKGALEDADVQKMTDAAIQYAALDAIAAIEAIPAEIVYDPAVKAAIETAREKYDALIDASKALVDDEVVAKLTNAEKAWADLVALIEHNVSYIGKDGELKNEKVALLHIPNPAPDFNGYEFVRWDVKAGDFLEEGLRIKAVYTPIITTDPVAYDTLVYNGTAQELVKAGVAKEGHIEYSLYPEEPESWSANLPTAINAGVYAVSYKLVREGHEDYMAGSVTAVIAKAPVTYVAPQAYDTLAYNYDTQVLVTAGQTNDGTIEYSLDPNMLDSWSADLPQAMNAGTYNVYFRVNGDMNHLDSVAATPVAVTIAKRDIVITAPVAYDTLVYNSLAQTLAVAGSADFGSMEYTMTPDNNEGWSADMPQAVDAGTYAVYYRVQGDANHNDFAASIAATVAKAQLTIMAEDKEVEYGESAPEFTVTFNGWQGQDDASAVSDLTISSDYAVGSSVGTYAIVPSGASALNYTMSYVNGSLTVNKAKVSVINAEAQKAKFADGHAVAVVLNQGTLDGVKLNDAVTHVTTAAFSSAEVAENLTITLFYELQGDEALLANYLLEPTSKIFSEEGVIIEPFLPDNEGEPEDKEAKIQEGIEVYAYGYCTGTGYSLNYHLNSGNPDRYKIEFEDSRFDDVAYEETEIKGRDGVIDIEIPDGLPTGDYKMTVTFRDSRFDWLESAPFEVTFHVNMPETYVKPLFNNTIVLVDTLDQFTDIQWYYRADATKTWQPVAGATGHYLHVDGKLEGEYFVAAKYKGKPTFTCGQADMETLYGADENKQAKVRAYPNPVVNTTTVSIENSENYEHSLRIVNLMGIEVKNTTFEGNETVVDMDSYTTGNYTISVDGIVVKVLKK